MAHEKHYKPGCPECIAERLAERRAQGIPDAPRNKMIAPPATIESAVAATTQPSRRARAKAEAEEDS